MATDTATSPDAGQPADDGVATPADDLDPDAAADAGAEGDLQATDGDDAEDVEFDGQQYRVPRPLKDALMRNADYTRKTQEVAAERERVTSEKKEIEQARERFQRDTEAHGANLRDMARLVAIGDQVAAYQQLNWAEIEQQDAVNGTQHAQRLFREQNQLEREAQTLAGQLHQREQQRQSEAQREIAQRKDQAQAVFAREIPGWNTGTRAALEKYAVDQGVSAEQFRETTNPVLMKILHKASLWDNLQTKQRATVKGATAIPRPAAAPVPRVAARRTPATGPQDTDSMDDWVKKERKRMEAVERARNA